LEVRQAALIMHTVTVRAKVVTSVWVSINHICIAASLDLLDNSIMETATLTLRLLFSSLKQPKDQGVGRSTVLNKNKWSEFILYELGLPLTYIGKGVS
jgi:hypothetical protein